MPPRVPCAGAIVVDDGRLLVVRRGHDPGRGLWSIPGGRVEAGESTAQAVVREVAEETGLEVAAGASVGLVERPGPDGSLYVIDDLDCTVLGGTGLTPGDDALEARWVTRSELVSLACVDLLVETLAGWGVLERLAP